MVGAALRAFVIFAFALLAGCGARRAGVTAPASGAATTPATKAPVYRFVSLGLTGSSGQQALGGGRIGLITDGWPGREIVGPDGSVEVAAPGTSENLMGAVPVPVRLGGGFLFWSDVLYRARSFTGPLEAIVALPTNAIGVEFGPDYVLVLLPNSPPRAFALDPPRPVPLSPKGVIDVVATDDGRGLALDATGRALASTDAGKNWKDVTGMLGAPVSGVREERDEVAFVSNGSGAWLQPDGQFSQHAFAAKPQPEPQAKTAALMRRAVAGGLALPGSRVLLGQGRGTVIVDLRTGSVSPIKPAGPEGSSCVPVSLDDEGLVVCMSWTSRPTMAVISHALGAAPVLEKTFPGSPEFLGGHALSVIASCSGPPAEGAACVRRSGGVWSAAKASPELLKVWQPLFWAARENGGVAAVVSERDVPEPKVALLDLETNHVTLWDTTPALVVPGGSRWHSEPNFRLLADGSLLGYAQTGTIAVDPSGHVTKSTRQFASISSAGVHALARDNDEHLWQTSDYGAHWLEIARPPFDAAPEGLAAKTNPRPSGRATSIECSPNGCALEHPSGTGAWLRLGWPEDPPQASSGPSAPRGARNEEKPTPAAPPLPEPVLPSLRCTARVGGPPRVTNSPPRPPEPKASGQWLDVLAGKRALASRPPRTFANLAYRDVFAADGDFVRYGLRASAHLSVGNAAQPGPVIDPRAAADVLFVEPLDPNGSIRHRTASSSTWLPSGERADDAPHRRRNPATVQLDLEELEGTARPLLGSAPGHAGGVLLISEALSLFAPNSSNIEAVRSGCSPVSGYVDAQGKLFVACAERNASTHIEALATPRQAIVRARAAAHYRDNDSPGMHFYAPGEPVFPNADAIAVAPDGALRILRLPPGDAPPTADNPAWLLSTDAAPIELAPWSTLTLATAPACAGGQGSRALVQTGKAWFNVAGKTASETAGMTALVRWSAERVCLEAVEVGFSSVDGGQSQAVHVSAVSRFAGTQPGAAFIGTESSAFVHEPATCELNEP